MGERISLVRRSLNFQGSAATGETLFFNRTGHFALPMI
jgi:hypothetical protein